MWTRLASALPLVALLTIAAAGADQNTGASGSPFAGEVTMIDSPAAAGSAQPAMTVDRSGRVWLSWLEPREGGGSRYRVASRQGSGWSAPVTIAEGESLLANWADVPAIFVTSTGSLAASWLERGPGRGSYGVRVRTSTDQGRTWTPTVTPHRDEGTGEHGFVAFFDAPGVGPGLIWLDGRDMARGQGDMALRATTVAGGSPGEEMLVDARVCDCCQTAAARIDDGVIVAYRDRSDDEIRDISVSRFKHGAWSAPATVHADNWQINACPVNGPVIAASGRSVAVAWFTLDGREPLTKVAFSTDGGESFSAPARIDLDQTVGRLGIAMPDANRVLVSSIERQADSTHVVVREVRRNGRTSDVVRIAPIDPGRSSGIPRMAVSGREVIFAWTDVSEDGRPSQIRVASARLK